MRSASGGGSIRKKVVRRNGTDYIYWEARYTAGRDPATGRQIQRSVSGKTQKEVRQKLAAATAAIDAGTYQESSRITLAQWLEIWQQDFLVDVKQTTRATYAAAIRNHIVPALGAARLDKLTTAQVQHFYGDLYGKLSVKTVRNIHGCLHEALARAVKAGVLAHNPCEGCVVTTPPDPEIRPLEPDEVLAFLQAAEGDFFHDLLVVALFTGLRQGELLGLPWSAVDFAAGTITVSQQLQRIGGSYQITTPKNGKGRTLVPAQLVMDALAGQKARQESWMARAGEYWQGRDNLVFTMESGACIARRTLDKHFKKILQKAGLPDMRFHDLRHTFAVSSLAAGDDLKTLQANLGHATAAFTLDVYGHRTEQMARDSGSRMQEFYDQLSGKGKIRENSDGGKIFKVI